MCRCVMTARAVVECCLFAAPWGARKGLRMDVEAKHHRSRPGAGQHGYQVMTFMK